LSTVCAGKRRLDPVKAKSCSGLAPASENQEVLDEEHDCLDEEHADFDHDFDDCDIAFGELFEHFII
jgi:hypothetical protein